jgi:hypothetical protein
LLASVGAFFFLQRGPVEDASKSRLNVANYEHGGQAGPLTRAMPMTVIDYIAISILIVLILWFVVEMRGLRKS